MISVRFNKFVAMAGAGRAHAPETGHGTVAPRRLKLAMPIPPDRMPAMNTAVAPGAVAQSVPPTGRAQAERPRENTTDIARIAGLGPLTRVTTSFGEVYAQALRVGDLVRTKDGRFRRIEKIDRMTFDQDFLKHHPGALPIQFRAGALGPNRPAADMTLAPYQRIHQMQQVMGQPLRHAVDAIGRPQVYRKPESIVTYTTFSCGGPVTVHCEGILIDMPG